MSAWHGQISSTDILHDAASLLGAFYMAGLSKSPRQYFRYILQLAASNRRVSDTQICGLDTGACQALSNGVDLHLACLGCVPASGCNGCLDGSVPIEFLPIDLPIDNHARWHIPAYRHSCLLAAMLQELASGRTSVFVAHRLSTVQRCDKIIVLSNGVVAEQGTHEELMAARRIYYDMWEVQKAADAEAEKVCLSSFSSYDDPDSNRNGRPSAQGQHPGRKLQTSQL